MDRKDRTGFVCYSKGEYSRKNMMIATVRLTGGDRI